MKPRSGKVNLQASTFHLTLKFHEDVRFCRNKRVSEVGFSRLGSAGDADERGKFFADLIQMVIGPNFRESPWQAEPPIVAV
jgi:hypothetical protein